MRSEITVAVPAPLADQTVKYVPCDDALPLPVRVSNLLGDMLILLDEVRSDLQLPEAGLISWAAPAVQRAYDDTSAALERISS
ncbi:MAG: hypothetical protein QOC81_3181 [Thermoanaerobaculia bacterium]|jgi:hypothetical protein|nr:hypothetical protein [Thermoanaerobaculia bacterium]